MLWSTVVSLITSTVSQGAFALQLPRWLLEPSTSLLATAAEPLQPLLPILTSEQATALGCNTSHTTTQWLGWLVVLAVLFLTQRPSEHERQQAIRIRSKRRD